MCVCVWMPVFLHGAIERLWETYCQLPRVVHCTMCVRLEWVCAWLVANVALFWYKCFWGELSRKLLMCYDPPGVYVDPVQQG